MRYILIVFAMIILPKLMISQVYESKLLDSFYRNHKTSDIGLIANCNGKLSFVYLSSLLRLGKSKKELFVSLKKNGLFEITDPALTYTPISKKKLDFVIENYNKLFKKDTDRKYSTINNNFVAYFAEIGLILYLNNNFLFDGSNVYETSLLRPEKVSSFKVCDTCSINHIPFYIKEIDMIFYNIEKSQNKGNKFLIAPKSYHRNRTGYLDTSKVVYKQGDTVLIEKGESHLIRYTIFKNNLKVKTAIIEISNKEIVLKSILYQYEWGGGWRELKTCAYDTKVLTSIGFELPRHLRDLVTAD